MSITRYDPFRELRLLQDEVNRLFSSNVSRSFDDEGLMRGAWTPSVDIYENKDQIVLEAELPGMNREEVKARRIEIGGESATSAPKTIETKAEPTGTDETKKKTATSGR